MAATPITTLFLDIGGVLLTNGWDSATRRQAAEKFGIDFSEMEVRHRLTFDTYETGKLSLDEYLDRSVFYQPRNFSRDEFKTHLYAQSKPFPDVIDLIKGIRARYSLKVLAVNNEGREINIYRIGTFGLSTFIDFFVSSCFVHLRKPDADIFRLALDLAQAQPEEVAYIDDRELFVDVARKLAIRGILHKDPNSTKSALAGMGLAI